MSIRKLARSSENETLTLVPVARDCISVDMGEGLLAKKNDGSVVLYKSSPCKRGASMLCKLGTHDPENAVSVQTALHGERFGSLGALPLCIEIPLSIHWTRRACTAGPAKSFTRVRLVASRAEFLPPN